jgi:hypothetical protein
VVYARFVALRRGLVLFASLVTALAFAAQAGAKDEPKAKFKVVSATGRQTLSFHEDSKGDFGNCVGSTASEVSWKTTQSRTVYVFVKYSSAFHRNTTILSTDRVGRIFEAVPIAGKATVSRSVDYQETAGCDQKPMDCPQTTSQAKLSLNGTPDAGASLYGGVDSIRLHGPLRNHFCDQLQMPFVYDARQALGTPKKVAFAVPRKQLLDQHRKVVKGSATTNESLGGKYNGATASGTYTDHFKIKLKRLKL